MDYYQKYLKYKAKYIATQTGGNVDDTFADLTGNDIPLELQQLDDAFLPGFNVDKKFVNLLLEGAKIARNPVDLIKFLKKLSGALYLNESADRLIAGQTKQEQSNITAKLTTDEASPNKAHEKALDFFKQVYVNYDLKTTDPAFQALDDAFLPGFNIDRAYVGHLYTYCTDEQNVTGVISKLQTLNNNTSNGLCAKGDRLSSGQKRKDKRQSKPSKKLA